MCTKRLWTTDILTQADQPTNQPYGESYQPPSDMVAGDTGTHQLCSSLNKIYKKFKYHALPFNSKLVVACCNEGLVTEFTVCYMYMPYGH